MIMLILDIKMVLLDELWDKTKDQFDDKIWFKIINATNNITFSTIHDQLSNLVYNTWRT